MKNKSASHLILTGLFAVLVLAASDSMVRAECPGTSNWIGGTGDWFDGDNWSNGCVPTSTIDATVNNEGKAQILGGSAAAKSLILGDDQGDTGSVTVDGASAVLDLGNSTCRGTIYVGNRGSGNLTIGNGGTIRSRYAYIAAVANPERPASSGNVTVASQGIQGVAWYLYDNLNEPTCTGAGLFIGCTADSNAGGTATVDLSSGSTIAVVNRGDAPGVTVGLSGTLTGNGIVHLSGTGATSLGKTVEVRGTLAPAGALEVRGNLNLQFLSANTVFHVTPQAWDNVQVTQTSGEGHATLGGRITVIMSGNFTAPMSFTLLYAVAGRNNTFDYESIIPPSGGPCFTPKINYDANSVKLVLETCD